jgi:hypothetical protein
MGIQGRIVARVCSCGFKDPNGTFVPNPKPREMTLEEKIEEILR